MNNVIDLTKYMTNQTDGSKIDPEKLMFCFSESQLIDIKYTLIEHVGEKFWDVVNQNSHLFFLGCLDPEENLINPTSDYVK